MKTIPKDRHGKISKEYLSVGLDSLAAFAGLPPLGAIDQVITSSFNSLCISVLLSKFDLWLQMDGIMTEALKMFDAGDGKTVKEDEFKKLLTEVLGSIMLQLEGNPVSVSVNSVVHEPIASSSTLLQPSSP